MITRIEAYSLKESGFLGLAPEAIAECGIRRLRETSQTWYSSLKGVE